MKPGIIKFLLLVIAGLLVIGGIILLYTGDTKLPNVIDERRIDVRVKVLGEVGSIIQRGAIDFYNRRILVVHSSYTLSVGEGVRSWLKLYRLVNGSLVNFRNISVGGGEILDVDMEDGYIAVVTGRLKLGFYGDVMLKIYRVSEGLIRRIPLDKGMVFKVEIIDNYVYVESLLNKEKKIYVLRLDGGEPEVITVPSIVEYPWIYGGGKIYVFKDDGVYLFREDVLDNLVSGMPIDYSISSRRFLIVLLRSENYIFKVASIDMLDSSLMWTVELGKFKNASLIDFPSEHLYILYRFEGRLFLDIYRVRDGSKVLGEPIKVNGLSLDMIVYVGGEYVVVGNLGEGYGIYVVRFGDGGFEIRDKSIVARGRGGSIQYVDVEEGRIELLIGVLEKDKLVAIEVTWG